MLGAGLNSGTMMRRAAAQLNATQLNETLFLLQGQVQVRPGWNARETFGRGVCHFIQ